MKRLLLTLAPVAFVFILSSNVKAADTTKPQQIFDPSVESAIQIKNNKLNINLNAEREKTEVKASTGFKFDNYFFDLSASGPIDEKADEVELSNLDGLANGFKYSVGLSYMYFNPQPPDIDKQTKICKEYAMKRFVDDNVTNDFCTTLNFDYKEIETITKSEIEKYVSDYESASSVPNADEKLKKQKAVCDRYKNARFNGATAPKDYCEKPDIAMFQATLGVTKEEAKSFQQRNSALIDKGHALFWGLKYQGNRNKYKYSDASTYADKSETKDGSGVIASIGYLTPSDNFFSFNYRNETSFKGAQKTQICTPLGSTPNFQCKDSALGAPEKKNDNIVELEYRRFFSDSFAVSPKFIYGLDDGTYGFDLPVYFLKGKSGLMGGVKLGWRSDTKDVTLGAFIGAALSFID